MHVLTPDGDSGQAGEGGAHCRVHEVFPGPLSWLLMYRRHGRSVANQHVPAQPGRPATRLNWKGRAAKGLRRLLAQICFPGEDAEWLPWAKRRLARVLNEYRPDVVISSHEPASSLLLGLEAKRRGFPWIADLGDPVCASYTEKRWRQKAMRLEATCMRDADGIIVPHEGARSFYVARHGVDEDKFLVLPQGYDDRAKEPGNRGKLSATGALELVFAGRVYPFRDPRALLRVVSDVPGVRLTMILADPPDRGLTGAFGDMPRIRFMHAMSHAAVREAQYEADVLVNIGNAGMPAQVPGKIFEYMGIPRPILHLRASSEQRDAPTDLIESHRRGWCCPNEYDQVHSMLIKLVGLAEANQLTVGLDLAPVRQYAFSRQGQQLAALLACVADNH